MTEEAKRPRWIPMIYYYLATVIGLVVLLIGLISGLQGLKDTIFPRLSGDAGFIKDQCRFRSPVDERLFREELRPQGEAGDPAEATPAERKQCEDDRLEEIRNRGLSKALDGFIGAIVGGAVFLWHLRQARRKEPEWLDEGDRGGPPKVPPPSVE